MACFCKYEMNMDRGLYMHLTPGCTHPEKDDGMCDRNECPLKKEEREREENRKA